MVPSIVCYVLLAAAAEPTSTAATLRLEGALVTLIEQTDVPARDAGLLTIAAVREGTVVATGDVLAKIEDDDARLSLEKALAEASIAEAEAANDVDVRFAKKAAELAQAELRRARESIDRFERSVSQTELDKLVLETERCTLAVESAEHEAQVALKTWKLKQTEVAQAKQVVDRRQIIAPHGGVVVEIYRGLGEWVKPGDPVLRMLRVDRVRIEAFVAADAIATLAVDTPVVFEPTGPGGTESYRGKIAFISPEVDPVNAQIRIWAEVDNENRRLRPGRRGTLIIP